MGGRKYRGAPESDCRSRASVSASRVFKFSIECARFTTLCCLRCRKQRYLKRAVNQLGYSPRGYHRVLRIARTLADMSSFESVSSQHIAEALSYRSLDRLATRR